MQQDSVNIPTFGTLTIKQLPAHYSSEDHTFLPPSKNVLFEPDEQVEDNGLKALLRRLHRLSEDMAQALLSNYIADLRESLLSAGEADLGNIGQFTQDEKGRLMFAPCEAGVAAPEFFALDVVEMRKLPAPIKVEPKFIDNMDSEYITIRLSRKGVRRTLRAAAAILIAFILIVPGLHYAKQYDVPTRIEAGFHQLYQHMLEIDFKSPREAAPPAQDVVVKSPVIQKVKPIPLKKEQPQTPAAAPAANKAEAAPAAAAKAQPESGSWCIVMASSTTEPLANAFIKRLEKMGVQGVIAVPERSGMMRVILPGFATEDDAILKARQLRDLDYDLYDIWTDKIK
jgi:cell division septation protein DedD